MKIIQEQNKIISKVWGKQKVKDKEYRLIKYSLTRKVDDGILLYNLITGELVLSQHFDESDISKFRNQYEEEFNELVEKRYLVPMDFDEYKTVKQLRKIVHQVENQREGIIGYTIMPTSHCNARCFYCFEAGYPHTHMSEETADQLVDYMVNHCNEEKFLNITWFGGEPTVGHKRIDQICKGLQENGINYSSFMYSNGYLFDDEMVKRAVDLWKLNKIQITLDGTEDVYNKAKAYKSAQGSPYYRVLDNIKRLLDAGIYVMIRLNMDFYNSKDLEKLIKELSIKLQGYTNISVYVSILFEDEGFEKVKHTNEEKLELETEKERLE
ncbi:MAG: 4Fe-4S cluster-binding domain-containing protein, partial [Holdemanella sp.]|nr:4Fe-4S cluster-binding domain-containing protein [Holdemanella sp.]